MSKTTAAKPTPEATEEPTPAPDLELPPASPASDEHAATWAALAAPFPLDWIEKLPKPLKSRDDNRGRCEAGSYYSADGHGCGGWHARSVHLDYIGHAGITMRLNAVVGPGGWTFEPVATTEDGLPLMRGGEFWARLTILGVSKVDLAANYSSTQEAWGDALRRCAMRFGMGTYLWAKSEYAAELATHQPEPGETPAERAAAAIATLKGRDDWTLEQLDAGETHARDNGYLLDDLVATLATARQRAQDRAATAPQAPAEQPAPATPQEPATAPQTPQEQPAGTPAPTVAGETPQEAAYDLARETLNSSDPEYLRGLYRSSPDLIRLDVLAVLGDDDLAALDAPRDLGELALGTLIMRVAEYVERHGNAVRDLGEPARPAPQQQQPAGEDPWAEDAANGWPDRNTPAP